MFRKDIPLHCSFGYFKTIRGHFHFTDDCWLFTINTLKFKLQLFILAFLPDYDLTMTYQVLLSPAKLIAILIRAPSAMTCNSDHQISFPLLNYISLYPWTLSGNCHKIHSQWIFHDQIVRTRVNISVRPVYNISLQSMVFKNSDTSYSVDLDINTFYSLYFAILLSGCHEMMQYWRFGLPMLYIEGITSFRTAYCVIQCKRKH